MLNFVRGSSNIGRAIRPKPILLAEDNKIQYCPTIATKGLHELILSIKEPFLNETLSFNKPAPKTA